MMVWAGVRVAGAAGSLFRVSKPGFCMAWHLILLGLGHELEDGMALWLVLATLRCLYS